MASKLEKKKLSNGKRSDKWSFRYIDTDGIHKRYTCKSILWEEAERERIDFISTLNALKSKKGTTNMLWDVLCAEFMKYARRKKKSPETYQYHLNTLDRTLKPRIKHVKDLTKARIDEYIDIRLAAGISKASINREINSFKAIFTWARRIEEYDIKNPLKTIEPFVTKWVVNERFLHPLEIQKVFTCLNDKIDAHGRPWNISDEKRDMIAAFIYSALYTGMRLKEIKTMQRTQILFNEHSVLVEPQKTSEIDPNAKKLPLATKYKQFLIDLFKKYPKEKYVVPNIAEYLRYKAGTNTSRMLKGIFEFLKIQGVTIHKCRHTFVSILANEGSIQDSDLMKYARIKKMEVLEVYRHVSTDFHRKNIDKLPF